MDLESFEREIDRRASVWRLAGATWEFRYGDPSWAKPSASVRVATQTVTAELAVWVSGEADLSWLDLTSSSAEIEVDHYELTSELGLRGCLDDLEAHLDIRT